MTTVSERKKIAELVLTTDDERVLEKIKTFLSLKAKMTKEKFVKQYNREIEEAIERVRKGKFITHKNAMRLLQEWGK